MIVWFYVFAELSDKKKKKEVVFILHKNKAELNI